MLRSELRGHADFFFFCDGGGGGVDGGKVFFWRGSMPRSRSRDESMC